MKIILASTSPRRIEMMGWLGVPFETTPSLFDEKTIRDSNPEVLTQKLAKAKVDSVTKKYPDAIIIGADLVVEFEEMILEKAESIEDQRRLLKMQNGKEATIYTSIYLINTSTGQKISKTVVVPYKMRNVSDKQIDDYINSGKGIDKAGGYGLQDFNGMFLESINGCYPGALGFPVCEISAALQKMGVKIGVDIKGLVKEKTGKDC